MSSTPFRIYPGFAVPFVQTEFPDASRTNPELRALFVERSQQGALYRNTSPTMQAGSDLFESRFDLFRWDDACVTRLRDFCVAALYKAVGELNGYSREELQGLDVAMDAWFHVTQPGGAFGLHNHPMASWSGVYCVDSGYEADATPESGALTFMHPAATSAMFVDLGVANLASPWAVRPHTYRLKPGQLIMFPSWVMHQVGAYTGPRERVTVAFNAWFRRPEGVPAQSRTAPGAA